VLKFCADASTISFLEIGVDFFDSGTIFLEGLGNPVIEREGIKTFEF
jgi:hypothetical protein